MSIVMMATRITKGELMGTSRYLCVARQYLCLKLGAS